MPYRGENLEDRFFHDKAQLVTKHLPIEFDCYVYLKVPKFSDAKKLCCNLP